jgi:mRNA interferase MazF
MPELVPQLVRRGDVYLAGLSPAEGSEQSGQRPVVVVSRDAINASSPVVVVVPVADRANKTRIYPSHVILKAGDGGLAIESVALTEQVRAINKSRFINYVGHLAPRSVMALESALKITLDLP